jgi:hypothetical protein
MDMKTLVHRYYEAWAAKDRDAVKKQVHDDLVFKSTEASFTSADAFLSTCWKYSDGLTGVEFLKEVYDDAQAFVIMRWHMEDGTTFIGAEYVRAELDLISEIIVISNNGSMAALFV